MTSLIIVMIFFTFRTDSRGAAPVIDHIAVSECLYDDVHKVEVLDSGINLSDHCPVGMDLSIPSKQMCKGTLHNYATLGGGWVG